MSAFKRPAVHHKMVNSRFESKSTSELLQ
ncbi:dihydroxy-acid dehydratase [Limnobacter sp. MED105]|nr:dihydroxy-acid dehydratase [Limnobacter sp. MED105]